MIAYGVSKLSISKIIILSKLMIIASNKWLFNLKSNNFGFSRITLCLKISLFYVSRNKKKIFIENMIYDRIYNVVALNLLVALSFPIHGGHYHYSNVIILETLVLLLRGALYK